MSIKYKGVIAQIKKRKDTITNALNELREIQKEVEYRNVSICFIPSLDTSISMNKYIQAMEDLDITDLFSEYV